MKSIQVRQSVGQDGILRLAIPVGLTEQDVEVVVIYEFVRSMVDRVQGSEVETLLPLAELYGVCADDPILLDELSS